MSETERTIGPYALVRSLGRGGFGEVWLAERRSSLLTVRVALKLPIVDTADIDQIRQEAQLWLQASGHPNIVPVLDAEVYDGQVAIASEYIAGGTLAAWLEKHGGKAPSIDAAISKTVSILSGLDYLHRTGLIHRDLKPDNVLLQDGAPRLTDFGLARYVHVDDPSGNISGTPRYMAPETFSGNFSTASDLWSVGVVLYEMLAGSPPFQGRDIIDLITAIQTREPEPLSAAVPQRYRDAVRRLLAKAPRDRYTSAAEALAALQSAPEPLPGVIQAQSGDIMAARKHNLPIQPTSYIGREREQAEVASLLQKTRLLTLTGSGGCGKTRLALQAAEQALPDYPDGVWFVELAPLSDPDLVAQSAASVLSIPEVPGQPPVTTLVNALRSKQVLLLLDNCEHLLEASASLADALIRGCPNVRIMASSREPLAISGEQTFRVPSLALPDPGLRPTPELLQQFEGVRLFVERANACSPDFRVTGENAAAVAAVCRRLDGIPLAIELAAARTRSLSVDQISQKLDDRFRLLTGGSRSALPRQQTLRSLIDWSYSLLTEPERTLLCRLSVFAGGWTLEAAEQIASDGERIEDWEILDLLTALADKSLLVAEHQGRETRYRLLETVRQYSHDRLEEAGAAEAIRTAHRDHYLALAEEAEPHFTTPAQGEWLARLDIEHDNLRAALSWCLQDPDGIEPGLRLAGALWRFWHTLGYISEGREQLARALARSSPETRTLARAKALNGFALLTWCGGDYDAARKLFEESTSIARERQDPITIAASLLGLGIVLLDLQELAAAEAIFEETAALCREIGDDWGLSLSLNNLGLLASAASDPERARRLHEGSLAIRRAMQDRWAISMSLNNLGILAAEEGDYERARALQSESLIIRRKIRDRAGIAYSLEAFGALAAHEGRLDHAARILGAAEAIRETIGAALPPGSRAAYDRVLEALGRADSGRAYEDQWQLGRAMSMGEAVDYALEE
jgi:non-specific serine/threonine protein kinase